MMFNDSPFFWFVNNEVIFLSYEVLSSFVVLNRDSSLEDKLDTYKEWTSRRPWKERKRANKARENSNLQLVPQIQDPELIFYGLHSGVVGLCKNELYQIVNGIEVSNCGYDKVKNVIPFIYIFVTISFFCSLIIIITKLCLHSVFHLMISKSI